MCPPGYYDDGFGAIHVLGHMMYGYTLLVLINQCVLNKLGKERNISGHLSDLWHTECSNLKVLKSPCLYIIYVYYIINILYI